MHVTDTGFACAYSCHSPEETPGLAGGYLLAGLTGESRKMCKCNGFAE